MSRYSKERPFLNQFQAYDFLRKGRNSPRGIRQYPTMRLRNPTVRQRAATQTSTHVWAYGDRFYNLAHRYYGNANYWWVIAWWNALPTEASMVEGLLIEIPLNIQEALQVLGAY
tara:strand:- start:243 stop:584 length:342 start_codon:yes stop_codon:yes gene_type:complete